MVNAPVSRAARITRSASGNLVVKNSEVLKLQDDTGVFHDTIKSFCTVSSLADPFHVQFPAIITSALLGVGSIALPWLARLATNFVKGGLKECMLEYVPNCSAATTGAFTAAFSSDPTDTGATNPTDLLQYRNSVDGPLWNRCMLKCPTKPLRFVPKTQLYSASDSDPALLRQDYDGVVHIAVPKQDSSGTADGKVLCHYTAVLEQPNPSSSGIPPTPGPVPATQTVVFGSPNLLLLGTSVTAWGGMTAAKFASCPSTASAKWTQWNVSATSVGYADGITMLDDASIHVEIIDDGRASIHSVLTVADRTGLPVRETYTLTYSHNANGGLTGVCDIPSHQGGLGLVFISMYDNDISGTVANITYNPATYVASAGPLVNNATYDNVSQYTFTNITFGASTVPVFVTDNYPTRLQPFHKIDASFLGSYRDGYVRGLIVANKDLTATSWRLYINGTTNVWPVSSAWDGTTYLGWTDSEPLDGTVDANRRVSVYTSSSAAAVTGTITIFWCGSDAP